jgi:serine/threonine protein kinase
MSGFSFTASPRIDSMQVTTPTAPTMNTNQSFSLEDLRDYKRFGRLFRAKQYLGAGADGTVTAFEHIESKEVIAVKTPHGAKAHPSSQLIREVESLKFLGKHDHVSYLISYSRNYFPRAPALFFQLCELGDVESYRHKVRSQQVEQGKSQRPYEATLWKLLKDMSLALDYMHNKLPNVYCHNDVKPSNILVAYPAGWKAPDGIPMEPVFKLTNFARMTPFPVPADTNPNDYAGTYEYAPNQPEVLIMKPSRDIWSLGATLQWLALGIHPVQSRKAFIRVLEYQGKPPPDMRDRNAWRKALPTIYRPLNVDKDDLFYHHDLPALPRELLHSWRPYSDQLNHWYQTLWHPNESERITAASLVKHCVPVVHSAMGIADSADRANECFEKAKALREQMRLRKSGQKGAPKYFRDRPPSYEGNNWDGFPLYLPHAHAKGFR